MRVIESTSDNRDVICRLATAVVAEWQKLDQVTKDDLLRGNGRSLHIIERRRR
jgi:hypothetical protein